MFSQRNWNFPGEQVRKRVEGQRPGRIRTNVPKETEIRSGNAICPG